MIETKRRNLTTQVSRVLSIASAASIALVLAGSAHADWADDFDGGFSATWIFDFTDDIGNPPTTGTSTFAVIEDGPDDYLRISHTTTANKDGGGGAADGFGFVNESFTDTGIFADINAKPSIGQQNLLGVIARGNVTNGTAYAAVVDFANSLFGIARTDNFFDFFVPLVVDSSVAIDSNEAYRIQFVALGSNLTAALTEVSTGDLVSLVSTVDGFYPSGVAGVLVETEYDGFDNPVAPIIGSFDEVQAVPEPSMAMLIGCGVGALALLGRRRMA
jgi:hypothetical protein